jgi:uncharacterized protein
MDLPRFTYHPDPLDTGSIVSSDAACRACGRARGFIYVGASNADEDLAGAICPWCIADGSAATRFDAEFIEAAGIGDYGSWDSVPDPVIAEVSRRTPGFIGWQQERCWTHCGDAAEYLGRAGRSELVGRWPEAIDAIRKEIGFEGEEWDDYFAALDVNRSPTAYVFRCRHCRAFGGYSDFD